MSVEIGGWIMSGNPQIAEVMDQADVFDFIVVDMQHSTITRREMEDILARLRCEKYVRLRKIDDSLICQALDAGSDHIILPNVISRLETVFDRSYGLYRSRDYGFSEESYSHDVIAQIEYPLENEVVESIFENVDGYIIGPYDMHKYGGTNANIYDYLNIARKKNIKCGYHLVFPTKEKLDELINDGYDFIALGTDCISVGEWCRQWKL